MKPTIKWTIVFATALIWGMFLLYWAVVHFNITGIE